MAEAAQEAQHEFWRPPLQSAASHEAARAEMVETCDRCGTEFIVGSRFCHTCGTGRMESATASRAWMTGALSWMISTAKSLAGVSTRLGLSTAAFVAFLGGLVCVLGALGVGVIFSARTVLDWQAVQMWRIEWLLGAVAAFSAGCLLKQAK